MFFWRFLFACLVFTLSIFVVPLAWAEEAANNNWLSISEEFNLETEVAEEIIPLRPGQLFDQGIWRGEKHGGDWLVLVEDDCPIDLPIDEACLTLDEKATTAQENVLSAGVGEINFSDNSDLISFYFYPDWWGEPTVSFDVRGLSREINAVQFALTFYTAEADQFYVLLNGVSAEETILFLPLRRWYLTELEIDHEKNRTRFRLDGGEWSQWTPWYKPGVVLDDLQLRGAVDGGDRFYLSNVETETAD